LRFVQRADEGLDIFARIESGRSRFELFGQEQVHSFIEDSGRHVEGEQVFDSSRPIAGFLGQFA